MIIILLLFLQNCNTIENNQDKFNNIKQIMKALKGTL